MKPINLIASALAVLLLFATLTGCATQQAAAPAQAARCSDRACF